MPEYVVDIGEATVNKETGEAVFIPVFREAITRCADCVHSDKDFLPGFIYCTRFGNKVTGYWFCKDGSADHATS